MSRTDGTATGTNDAVSSFVVQADSAMTRGERWRQRFQTGVVAPFLILLGDWRAVVGLTIVTFYALMGTVGVVLIPAPEANAGPRLLGPFVDLAFPLGTDSIGQGLFRSVVHATPSMLQMVLSGAVFATVMATVVGTVGGYKRGRIDGALMILTDVMMTIPGLPFIIVIAAIFEPRDPLVVGVLLTINAWAGTARSIRSQVLSLRSKSYVEASRMMGIGTPRIIRKDILPNVMPYALMGFVQAARTVIFSSVGLYFLGILPFAKLNWGVMMNLAYYSGGAIYSFRSAHWLLVPMVTIVILSLGLILLAQGFDRIFNPRLRAKHLDDDAEVSG